MQEWILHHQNERERPTSIAKMSLALQYLEVNMIECFTSCTYFKPNWVHKATSVAIAAKDRHVQNVRYM